MTKSSEQHLAHIRNAAEEILRDPHGFSAFVDEIARGLLDDEKRSFCLIVSASCNEIGLEMLKLFGETAKMVQKDFPPPQLEGFVDTKTPVGESKE